MSDSALESHVQQAGDAFQALRRGIGRGRGFSLYLASCSSAKTRDKLIGNLAASIPGNAVRRLELGPDDVDVLDAVQRSLEEESAVAVMVVGIERLLDDDGRADRLLATLNLRRAEWPGRVPAAVVFWVPRRVIGRLMRGAPDFFDWRSDSLEFPELTTVQARVLANRDWGYGPDPRFTADERQARIAELRARIAAVSGGRDNPEIASTTLSWWDELAEHLKLMGGLDEALRIHTEEQLPAYERLGDARAKAVIQGKIADVLEARGELDEALRIRTEEELPVFERFGDVREKAVTRGRIADILLARGELDEALRIHTEEQLPVYERLGDVHSTAVTQGKIADILQAHGELDEALRIRTEEQLPVYERLGDVRSKAVTQGKIADIIQARGELDEALRIRTEEELPVFERLGDVREKAITLGRIADIVQARGELDEALRIRTEEELPVYQRLGDVHSMAVTQGQVAEILQARGELEEAVRVLSEDVLPTIERLGDVRSLIRAKAKMALLYLEIDSVGHRDDATQLLCWALAAARRLRLPDAARIQNLLEEQGLQCPDEPPQDNTDPH